MASLKISESDYGAVFDHLFSEPGEHFAFLRAAVLRTGQELVLQVREVLLVPDTMVRREADGWSVGVEGVIAALNAVVGTHDVIVEVHNHEYGPPQFSRVDRIQLDEFLRFVFECLPDRPYVATVWCRDGVHGEAYHPDGARDLVERFTVTGGRLRQLADLSAPQNVVSPLHHRQLDWFTEKGQKQLQTLRVAVVGLGGTGSQVVQNLAYLGVRDFVLIDPDHVEQSNLNRLVTAFSTDDLEMGKTFVAERLIRRVSRDAEVSTWPTPVLSPSAIQSLKAADVIFGCVDNDGARLVLNELAVAFGIPLFDVAVGIDVEDQRVSRVGARVAAVIPEQPCLLCMGEIDLAEARYWLGPEHERTQARERGYVTGMEVVAPAVVSINAQAAATAVNEFLVLTTGVRPVSSLQDIDVLGLGRPRPGQWSQPIDVTRDPTCLACSLAGMGEEAGLERHLPGAQDRTDA